MSAHAVVLGGGGSSAMAMPRISIQSLGTIQGLPPDVSAEAETEVIADDEHTCTICRLPMHNSEDDCATNRVVCLQPCNHRFHRTCFQHTLQMQRTRTGYYSNGLSRRPHCPLCRAPTTTRVARPKPASSGCHKKALASSTTPVLTSVTQLGADRTHTWTHTPTASLPIKADELVPLTVDDPRWHTFVPGQTPLYMPSHGVHGILVYTTKKMASVRVYPDTGVQRQFGKHKVAAIADTWGHAEDAPAVSANAS